MLSKSLRGLAFAVVAASILGGCVAGAIFPLPASSSSSSSNEKPR